MQKPLEYDLFQNFVKEITTKTKKNELTSFRNR